MSEKSTVIERFFGKGVKTRERIAIQYLKLIYSKKSGNWGRDQKRRLLGLFHSAASEVKAYKDFLKKAKISSASIKTYDDFLSIPPICKDNYLRSYTWEHLCAPHSLNRQSLVLTSTSGSTGKSFYFPRNGQLDAQSSIYHLMFMKNAGIDPKKSTLVIVCFGMGVWIGGTITYQAFKSVSECGYPLTIITPGVNKKEIYEAMKTIAPKYEQVILCGYPPFMKDVIDEAGENGINWKKHKIKLIFAAESFSEKFRDYMIKKTGIKNIYRDTMNIYGSADLGTMAEETPICILIRRLALKNSRLYQRLFKSNRLPTLAQYIPDFINFESVDGHIYCSGDNVLPLVRYQIGDNGSVLLFHEVEGIFKEFGIDLYSEARRVGIGSTLTELPFVCIYERTDFSTKLYGAIIYPEYVKSSLHNSEIEKYLTGKFTMFTKHDDKQDEYLDVNVELKQGFTESDWLKEEVRKCIFEGLKEKSAEYRYLAGMLNGKVKPRVTFWPHEHPMYFQTGIKQKWVKK